MLKKVFEEKKIGTMTLKNRLVVPAMVTNYTNEDGSATERYISYYEAKAQGGWGLIITENYKVAEDGTKYRNLPGLYKDELIESHKALTKRVHDADCKIIAQLSHAGRTANTDVTKTRSIAPSPIPYKGIEELPKTMTEDDIEDIINKYAQAARRAKEAGFDGVELNGGHGYLIDQFLSPFSNKRGDEYGGTLYNRAKFPLEIVKAIRALTGEDYPIIFRMSVQEYMEGGVSLEESKAFACMLEDIGVQAIHCSQGYFGYSGPVTIPPFGTPKGFYVDNAAAIKSVVGIPVIAVGRINDVFLAEEILRSGKADFVSMGRASWADPNLPNKAKENNFEDIMPCIGCLQGCVTHRRCLVNPMTGMESQYDLSQSESPQKVFIAGAGVSGCFAALAAAKKGHSVIVYEQSDRIGGQWNLAAVPIGKTEFIALSIWLKRQMKKLNVEIKLNTILTKEIVDIEEPNVVFVATGSKPIIPPISGVDQSHVVTAHEVLKGEVLVGKHVVIIGGGLVGAETADYLAVHGRKVHLVEMEKEIIRDGEAMPKLQLMNRMKKNQVEIHTETKVYEIEEHKVVVEKNGEHYVIDNVDSVIVAVGVASCRDLLNELKDYPGRVIAIGDASQTKNGYQNIQESFEAGLLI